MAKAQPNTRLYAVPKTTLGKIRAGYGNLNPALKIVAPVAIAAATLAGVSGMAAIVGTGIAVAAGNAAVLGALTTGAATGALLTGAGYALLGAVSAPLAGLMAGKLWSAGDRIAKFNSLRNREIQSLRDRDIAIEPDGRRVSVSNMPASTAANFVERTFKGLVDGDFGTFTKAIGGAVMLPIGVAVTAQAAVAAFSSVGAAAVVGFAGKIGTFAVAQGLVAGAGVAWAGFGAVFSGSAAREGKYLSGNSQSVNNSMADILQERASWEVEVTLKMQKQLAKSLPVAPAATAAVPKMEVQAKSEAVREPVNPSSGSDYKGGGAVKSSLAERIEIIRARSASPKLPEHDLEEGPSMRMS